MLCVAITISSKSLRSLTDYFDCEISSNNILRTPDQHRSIQLVKHFSLAAETNAPSKNQPFNLLCSHFLSVGLGTLSAHFAEVVSIIVC